MTSPRHAEATALGRYYTHPVTGQQLISVTNALSVGCAKPALVPWAAKIAAEYAIEHQGSLMRKSRTDPDGAIKDIKAQVTVARDKAADLGTAVHKAAERHALGLPPDDDEYADQVGPFLAQYLQFLTDFDVDLDQHVEATEMTVANPVLGYAGTLDALIHLNLQGSLLGKTTHSDTRQLWLIDYKTSTTRPATSVYGEYALQLTGLATATEMWLPNDTVEPFRMSLGGVAVLNLRPKKYELIPLPFSNAEREAFLGCLRLAKWMHDTGKDIAASNYRPITPAGRAKPKRTTKTTTTKAA